MDPDVANIRVDPDQLEQVLMNLAVNARDAMPDRGVLCIGTTNTTFDDAFVRAHPGAKAGAYVAVSVSDTGDGMDGDTAAQVFEPVACTYQEYGLNHGSRSGHFLEDWYLRAKLEVLHPA